MKRKCVEVNYLLTVQYCVNNNTKFKTLILRSEFQYFNGKYIVVKKIAVAGTNINNISNKSKLLKSCTFHFMHIKNH